MKRNSRLSLALHTLGHMAGDPDRIRTSADIAEHAGTNPVVVRRVLGKLREAGLLISEKGHAGGWRLARGPEQITLADVYLALDERLVAGGAEEEDAPSCSIEHALQRKVASVLEEVERGLIERLAVTTIAEVREANDMAHSPERVAPLISKPSRPL
ncbi:Rrf2 family transcriptional regulator, group III [Candidatus Rhodobacter oscarellae]|uniref:Rrf2 family transcriptional regulator, group III n=1 Tax=Candidatus Rhodobacter oscarellae TaxID=1675527 RepID=A0A0J9GVZ7_9RHOB|nr:Rrf2 family transcriptional regulator [Candidatus Rhodobacter lobularis]KMW57738.1 Rrf2 family transcriptional regulator, group III [Candidatus Rhodobacter lobularis]